MSTVAVVHRETKSWKIVFWQCYFSFRTGLRLRICCVQHPFLI
jgi:hypothetical protein